MVNFDFKNGNLKNFITAGNSCSSTLVKRTRQIVLTAASCSVLQVAIRCGVSSDKVKNVIIWGNHSSTQYPDVHHAKVDLHGAETGVYEAVKDEAWLRGDFISVSVHHLSRTLAGHI